MVLIVSAATLAALMYFAARTARDLRPVATRPGGEIDRAIAIARQRMLRGEIDRSQFERVVDVLRN